MNPATASTYLSWSLIPVLVLFFATSFEGASGGESHLSRSTSTFYQEPMTPAEAHNYLKRRGIEYNPEVFLERVKNGETQLVRIFLDAGIAPNAKGDSGQTALMVAASSANDHIVSLLLEKGANVN